MQVPAHRRRATWARRRALTCVTALVAIAALVNGCAATRPAPADAAYGVPIQINTPQGLRAKQTMDMLNSDWPIGENGIRTLAAPQVVEAVGVTMDRMWWDRPFTVTKVDVGAGSATLHILTSYGVAQTIELRTDDAGMVDRFSVDLVPPRITSFNDVDAEITKTGAKYSYQVAKVTDGRCEKVAGTNTEMSLPLASIFKLYVLYALSDAVKAHTVSWTDPLTITAEAKAVGSSGFDKMPPGSTVSVRDAAQQMISASDNMATDLLIGRLGTGAIERALVAAGHHDPASMTPFPTMHELFSVGWGEPNIREQWKQANHAGRAQLLQQTNSRPYEPDPQRTHMPASDIGAEWYASAADICRLHAALQRNATAEASPVHDILSAVPGIDLDRTEWPYIAAKAGNLPGDLTFSWFATDRTGQSWVVSMQTNWSQYRSPTAASWLLSIARQMFGLVQP
ncbi:serine hydrolase [Mycolicibacterium sp. 018/SC-01/001]|uniref:serine hydrolase n=1 Tax=Mycolicibacterium sp. 018/SC-01/001 TaxID=2592069 RepID=UPI00163D47E0